MRKGVRGFLIVVSAAAAVAAAAGLAVLKVGRPVAYTDGAAVAFVDRLVDASMLTYGRPTPVCELPGPVEGRVQPLPDGSYVYGRRTEDGVADLVVFDPRNVDAGAVAWAALNSPQSEFAPALGADGRLYFASDRPGGAGGFDVWSARLDGRTARDVRREGPAVNTELDETDPAPDPRGGLVFVRRDPAVREGRNGALYRAVGELAAEPLRPDDALPAGTIDRDPAFAADGVGLWFVRSVPGFPATVMRTWRHGDAFVRPRDVRDVSGAGAYRGPAPERDGLGVLVVAPAPTPTLLRADAIELYPYPEGAADLERALRIALGLALLFLALLLLGRRFRQLDFVTWCLLISLLLHLLVLWLLRDVLIERRLAAEEGDGRFEVALVSAGGEAGGSAGGAEALAVRQDAALSDPAAHLRFQGTDVALSEPARPAAAPAASESAATLEPSELAAASLVRSAVADAAPTAPQDAADASGPTRTGADAAEAAARAAALPAPTPAVASARPARSDAAVDGPVVVAAPAAAAERAASAAARDAATNAGASGAEAPAPQPTPSAAAPGVADLADAVPVDGPVRRGADAPSAGPARTTAADVAAAAASSPAPSRSAADDAGGVVEAAAPPTAAPVAGTRATSFGDALAAASPAPPRRVVAAPTAAPADLPEGGGASEGGAASAVRSGSDGVAAAPRPSASGAVAPSTDVAAAPRRTDAAGGGGDRVDVVAPEASVRRATRAAEAAAASAGDAPAPVRRRTFAAGPATPADRPTVPAAAADAVERAAAVVAKADAAPSAPRRGRAGALDGPDAGASPRPRRAAFDLAGLGAGADPAGGVRPPGSDVARAARASEDAGADVAATGVFRNRFGVGKTDALERFGGGAETERAVAQGLKYLASIQNADGSWGTRRGRRSEKYGDVDVGKSALCLLAFLGGGHLPGSAAEHAGPAARAVAYLLSEQDARTGHFGVSCAYSHGIATYALAECFGLTKDEALRAPLSRAIAWIEKNQNRGRDRRNRGGWGYYSPSIPPEDAFARTSVSSWQIMALESAKLAGLPVRADALTLAREFVLQEYDAERGLFLYNREPGRLASAWSTLPASTPAAVFVLRLLGTSADDPRLKSALDFTLARAPGRYRRATQDDFVTEAEGNTYFWYYGTLATFLAGGEAWETWNARLKATLLPAQAADGSFAPIDPYADYAGDTARHRAYTTALCVLSLEVYYRYFTPLLLGR